MSLQNWLTSLDRLRSLGIPPRLRKTLRRIRDDTVRHPERSEEPAPSDLEWIPPPLPLRRDDTL